MDTVTLLTGHPDPRVILRGCGVYYSVRYVRQLKAMDHWNKQELVLTCYVIVTSRVTS